MSWIEAVFFDVGETIVNETREYGTWADWLGVPRHTFSAVFGAVIARGGDYRETFQHFRPGFDTWPPSGSDALRRASRRASPRRTSIRMRDRASPSYGRWVCGSAWRAIRLPTPRGS